jgi:spore maturation protein SpmA
VCVMLVLLMTAEKAWTVIRDGRDNRVLQLLHPIKREDLLTLLSGTERANSMLILGVSSNHFDFENAANPRCGCVKINLCLAYIIYAKHR